MEGRKGLWQADLWSTGWVRAGSEEGWESAFRKTVGAAGFGVGQDSQGRSFQKLGAFNSPVTCEGVPEKSEET